MAKKQGPYPTIPKSAFYAAGSGAGNRNVILDRPDPRKPRSVVLRMVIGGMDNEFFFKELSFAAITWRGLGLPLFPNGGGRGF